MIIKPAVGRAQDIEALEALQAGAKLDERLRKRIEQEIVRIRAGEKGEREAAYEIDFHHRASRNWAVIHDLRIEHEGCVAQIDHLLINRFLDVYVCETKHFNEGVSINEHGEFTRFHNRQPRPMASPIEQNRKHIRVLDAILKSDKVTLPTRLGMAIRPRFYPVILISQGARITRPSIEVDGLETVIKSDQLRALIDRHVDDESIGSALRTVGKLIGSETLESFASQVARLHRPHRHDWSHLAVVEAAGTPLARKTAAVTIPVAPQRPVPACDRRDGKDGGSVDPAADRTWLPTSKLGATMGLPNLETTLHRLASAGLLQRVEDRFVLTPAGITAGGEWIEKGRYGPYFRWPRDLRC